MDEITKDTYLKLLLIGDSGVGKTCLLFRLTDGAFKTFFLSVVGIDFKIKTIELDGVKVKLQIWDSTGQERFHSLITPYYKDAMGIILVYDITNAKSFENLSKWLQNVDEHARKDVEKLILGNKCDMEEKRQVPKEKGAQVACANEIAFKETSARFNIDVESAFIELAASIVKKVGSGQFSSNDLIEDDIIA